MTTSKHSKTAVRATLLFTAVSSVYALYGCGSDSPTSATGDGTGGGFFLTGGTAGMAGFGTSTSGGFGGTVGSGGLGSGGIAVASGGLGGATSGGAAGAGSGGVTGDASTCVVPPDSQLLPTAGFKDCAVPSLKSCINGKCVPSTLVPKESAAQLADCSATEKCVPSYFVARNAHFIVSTCESLKGAEGRCLSLCIPQIADQESFLPRAGCDLGDLCAPCFDPRTGADTGACSQGCDTGPTKPAVLFDKCCKSHGVCVPKSAVPAGSVDLLGKDTCKTADEVCAPDKLADATQKPKQCKSLKDAEGRCLADCVPAVAAQASRLPKDVCDDGELCAPCFDPLTGLSTGACNQNGDTPVNPTPVTFPKCCTDLGHCVPTNILTTDQKTLLGADKCTGGDLCAPDVFAVSGQTADTCRALGSLNAEGRCVPSCVPSIQSQKDRLDQGTPKTCADGTLCAPCYDPITGADTGACSQNGDKPKEAKKVFTTCCGGLGSCVPPTLVPADQKSQLGHDTCGAPADLLCAPKKLTDPGSKPTSCRAPGDIEARCLPACLPPIQAQASNLRQVTCGAGELCADCYNPIDGTNTHACEINGDKPAEPVKKFPTCANARGLCVPKDLVPATLQTALPADTCTGANVLCAPVEKVKDLAYKFPKCDAQIAPFPPDTSKPAACLPKYIIDFQAKTNAFAGLLGRSNCTNTNDICAPCTDPTSGKNTGACD